MGKVVMPSKYILNTLGFSEVGQQHAKLCFYPVYNGLKYFCSEIDPRRLSKAKQAKKASEDRVLFGTALDMLGDLGPINFGFLEAVHWAHCLYLANMLFRNGISEDEVTRGIRHISENMEIPVWVTFGMQLHVELRAVLGDSIGEAFKEVQRDIVMTSYRDNALVASKNPLAVYRNVLTEEDYLKVLPWLKSFLLTGDRLILEVSEYAGMGMAYHRLQTGALLRQKHYFWRNHPIRCRLVKYHLSGLSRKNALQSEEKHNHILSVIHLYNLCRNIFPGAPH
jgi:hypothetical protein